MLKIYTYKSCSTCRNATAWLKAQSIRFEEHPIRETPPTLHELQSILAAREGNIRPLFNTSGLDYRALNLKDKLPSMKPEEALRLLQNNGNLVKRPFALDESKGIHLLGFRESEWRAALS